MMTIQNYVRAQSLQEAYDLNQVKRNRVIGGMMWLRLGSGSVNTAIDLCQLGLNTIEETEEQFSIGAMVTLRQIELHLTPSALPIDSNVLTRLPSDCFIYIPQNMYGEFATDYFWSSMMKYIKTLEN